MILETLLAVGVTVTLPMNAEVAGTEILLGEIAIVQGTDPELVRLIESIDVGYSPAPGYSRLLRADKLHQIVARRAPHVSVRFAGERTCRVRPLVREVPGAELLDAARTELDLAFSDEDATFVPVGEPLGVAVPAGLKSHEVRARLLPQAVTSGTVNVPVQVLVDGVVYRTVWTNWEVSAWQTVAVLAQPVRAGEAIHPAHLERKRVRLQNGTELTPLPAQFLSGAVAVRDLSVGETVTHLDIHRPTVISVGDSVFLRVRKGRITATVAGVAMQAGAVGDRIGVRTAGSDLDRRAVVLSRDLVRIDLGN